MPHPISRREAIKKASLAAGIGALGGVWTEGVVAQSKSPNSKLNIACVGAGGKGAEDIRNVSTENIVALCDVDEQRAAAMFNQFPDAKKYADFRKMFDEMGKKIDAVVVSVPDHSHTVIASAALKLKKHVYCQKPLTHTVYEARYLTELAAKTKVATQMGTQGHAYEGYFRLVEMIQKDVIGAVKEAHVWTDRPIWPQSLKRPTQIVPTPKTLDWDQWLGPAASRLYHPSYAPFVWRGWWDFGTGALGDMACHLMDPVFWALQLGAPTSVEGECEGITLDSPPKSSIIRYDFPKRGNLPPVRMTWYDGGKMPAKELFGDDPVPKIENGSLFIGSKGKLLISHSEMPILLPTAQYGADFKGPDPYMKRSPGHYIEWINACKGDRKTGSPFSYAGPMTEAILLGNIALRSGKKIAWDSKRFKITNDTDANALLHEEYRDGWSLS